MLNMYSTKMLMVLVVVAQFGQATPAATNQSKTYPETRGLLLKMERRASSKSLKKVFEEGDTRMPDLIQALSDTEEQVNLNAQVVIKYLAEPKGLADLDAWYKRQGVYTVPIMKLLPEPRLLRGKDSDLAKLLLKNASLLEACRGGADNLSTKLIGYNKNLSTALIEVVDGEVFTTGWHVVIRQEGGQRWWLISDNLVWQS